MSHTPGPWTLNGSSIEVPDRFNSGMSATLVHIYDERDIALDPCEIAANARLIAAAPELLQWAKDAFASQNCVCKLNPLVGGPVPCQTCQLGSLIVKATGGKL